MRNNMKKILFAILVLVLIIGCGKPETKQQESLGQEIEESETLEATEEEKAEAENNLVRVAGTEKPLVEIYGVSFRPTELKIKEGTEVTWKVIYPAFKYTVTSETFSSGDLKYGNTYKHTFAEKGTYEYYSKYHDDMKGTIVVE